MAYPEGHIWVADDEEHRGPGRRVGGERGAEGGEVMSDAGVGGLESLGDWHEERDQPAVGQPALLPFPACAVSACPGLHDAERLPVLDGGVQKVAEETRLGRHAVDERRLLRRVRLGHQQLHGNTERGSGGRICGVGMDMRG